MSIHPPKPVVRISGLFVRVTWEHTSTPKSCRSPIKYIFKNFFLLVYMWIVCLSVWRHTLMWVPVKTRRHIGFSRPSQAMVKYPMWNLGTKPKSFARVAMSLNTEPLSSPVSEFLICSLTESFIYMGLVIISLLDPQIRDPQRKSQGLLKYHKEDPITCKWFSWKNNFCAFC